MWAVIEFLSVVANNIKLPPDERGLPATPEAVRQHLSVVLESDSLRSSRRCKDFLRFVVEIALDGHADILKERTIADKVFGRPDYDPATDTLVRVGANELRKRLSQYYEATPESPVRIDLPTGSYVPEFHVMEFNQPAIAAVAPEPTPPAAKRVFPRRIALLAGVTAAGAVAGFLFRSAPTPLDQFWAPLLTSSEPLLISDPSGGTPRFVLVPRDAAGLQRRLRDGTPLMGFRPDEIVESGEVITTGSAHSVVTVFGFLVSRARPPLLRIATELVPGDLKNRPLIFLGAFNNPWTLDMNRNLRFAFQVVTDDSGWKMAVVDRTKPGRKWVAETSNHFYDATIDYGIVSRVVSSTGQVIVSIAGVTHFGTRAAAEFSVGEDQWKQVAREAPKDWHKKNIQVLFETKIVGRTPGPPRLIETHFW